MNPWSIQEARDLYNITQWSDDFFDINREGNIVAYPNGRDKAPIVLPKLVEDIQKSGLSLPILIRFPAILRQRFQRLTNTFAQAMQEYHYQGRYTAVYPIKVNQQRRVVDEILRHPEAAIGLEAGSKPELLLVLSLAVKEECMIVCNGYKDREYIRLALIGQQMKNRVYIILEKLSELPLVIEESKKLGVTPHLGIRVRLAATGKGKWQDTGGSKSKFGFSASQVLHCIEQLKAANMLHTLDALHFHLGSQIANIRDIAHGMRECARYYAELHQLGVNIRIVDVGGGLAIDYDGTHSRNDCSMNYSMQEYANNIVYALRTVCDENDLPHPDIVTESGRAMTAHHALLVTNVIDTETVDRPETVVAPNEHDAALLHDMWQGYLEVSQRSVLESYHDASYWLSEMYSRYSLNVISLSERAKAEQIYYATCHKVRQYLNPKIRAHREALDELNEKLADKYFCNFSLFQSLPDAWAIDQIFPIMPLSQLHLEPTKRVVLQDVTCDSDGRVDWYVDGQGIETTMNLLPYNPDRPYLLGMFLVGAYQEILGDMHNLFGDTDSINVECSEDGRYQLLHAEQGDTVTEVLHYVHFSPEEVTRSYQSQLEQCTHLDPDKRQAMLQELTDGLSGYTYLEQ